MIQGSDDNRNLGQGLAKRERRCSDLGATSRNRGKQTPKIVAKTPAKGWQIPSRLETEGKSVLVLLW